MRLGFDQKTDAGSKLLDSMAMPHCSLANTFEIYRFGERLAGGDAQPESRDPFNDGSKRVSRRELGS